jgi:hypothetical protein
VIVDGRIVVRRGELVDIDEQEVMGKVREIASRIGRWQT